MKTQTPLSVYRIGSFSWQYSSRVAWVSTLLFVLVAALGGVALTMGKFPISYTSLGNFLMGEETSRITERILMHIRLPRMLTAVFVGASLGAAGAVFQSISRNPLGSPDVIGFTTGAATGALVNIILLNNGVLGVALCAILGGMITAVVVYFLSLDKRQISSYRMILIGIGVGAILAALNGLMLVWGDIDSAITANLWLSGSLNARKWSDVASVGFGLLICIPVLKWSVRSLSLIEMGEDIAAQLGVAIERMRAISLFAAVILAALATGAAGPIAFIALAAPQLVRRVTRHHSVPVVSAALMGALLLLLADLLTQWAPLNLTLPIGQVTGIVGGIYLIWLLTRTR
ncbi:FecCD family ABC transporter permease [Vibrio olivae]|uniref:FecCD family ABC transporter permease n=1 Tax=Vibrio olivae TaxID=1243002 RepID=A0ABV5HR04_9VIBR